MPISTETSYDSVPYLSLPYPDTHPDRLCTIGRLFGMHPAHPTSCNVLEIGCAAGGNLLPMAEQLPECRFTGIDLSGRQIDEGNENIRESGLTNIELRHVDILEFNYPPERFDYIICHGVYSWVPRDVREKILTICSEALTPQGIGYVSFNTYPGWHLRESTRHMMRYHAARFSSPEERVTQARNLLSFLVNQLEDNDDPYALLLKKELGTLSEKEDYYLFHEHLEAVNTPCYFYEFNEKIESFGLQYLGDADLSSMLGHEMPQATRERIGAISENIIQMEQYYDFIRNRQFRKTLVCRNNIRLNRSLDGNSVKKMRYLLAPFENNTPVNLTEGVEHTFITSDNRKIETRSSLMKAAINVLMTAWPVNCSLEEVTTTALTALSDAGCAVPPRDKAENDIASGILQITGRGGVTLRSWGPPLTVKADAFPKISRISMITARRYGFVINAYHERRVLSDAVVHLALLLDGTRDKEMLLEEMIVLACRKAFTVTVDGKEVESPDRMRIPLTDIIDTTLDKLAKALVLVPE